VRCNVIFALLWTDRFSSKTRVQCLGASTNATFNTIDWGEQLLVPQRNISCAAVQAAFRPIIAAGRPLTPPLDRIHSPSP
jgi:hypothetical protein